MSAEDILKEVFQKKEITKEDIKEALKEMSKVREECHRDINYMGKIKNRS